MPTRKHNVAIHVHPDGLVQVDAPPNTHLPEIRKTVQKRARWVLKHLDEIAIHSKNVLPREYVSGETHFYLGKRYLLKVLEEKCNCVKLTHGKLQIQTIDKSPQNVKNLLWNWYKIHSHIVFHRRLKATIINISWINDEVPEWRLLKMKKQWGSCSPKGVISLNPHLVKAPGDCIDYVILHESCHLKEHNHSKQFYKLLDQSKQFYKLLDQNMPDWKERKAKLDGMK